MKKNKEKIRIGIIGAASISSGVLLKLLANHKYATITLLVSETKGGEKISDIHKFLEGIFELKSSEYNADKVIEKCDVIFLSKPHGEFLTETSDLVKKAQKTKSNIKFIDLSANFRLKDVDLYKWYGFEQNNKQLLNKAVYGLPEIYSQKIKDAFFIANPGCYPTCTILSVAPLFINKLIEKKEIIIIEAICGVSGAGRKPNDRNLAIEVEGNIKPYKIGIHPHIPEIEQELGDLIQDKVKVLFAPHVASFKYGMLTTTYIKLHKRMTFESLVEKYQEFYKDKPFIRICKQGEYPEIQNVEGTNFCDIGIQVDERTSTYIVMGCIDNIIKGAAGQAVQNMNIMFGLDETEGLPFSNALKKTVMVN
ncbi:MAG: N-acetyl-gamma-glutamyl-phosphate reductase [bacterium]